MIKLKPGMEVRCRDERQAKEFIKLAYEQGYSWPLDLVKSEIEHTSWERANKRLGMVYCLEDNYLIKYRVNPNIDNGIIEYSVLVKGEYTTMKKSDLKNGMVVEFRDKSRGLVHNERIIDKEEFLFISNLNDDLMNDSGFKDLDIMKIFDSNAPTLRDLFNDTNLELIWERKKQQKLSDKDKKVIKRGLAKAREYCKTHLVCDKCELYDNNGDCFLDRVPAHIEVDKLFKD